MSTVVPVIYSIRSTLNENKSLEDQTDAVADAMLRLERLHSGFDDLDIVKNARELFSELLVQNGTDINVKSHLHGKGFEPIKRELIEKHIRSISHPESLVDYTFKEPPSKKQKSGGFSYAFDFDNMPMFESFESILACIRADAGDLAALEKMMAMDLSELVDHHQWEEALLLLYNSLSKVSEPRGVLLVLAMMQRYVVGFVGTGQGLDTINCALRYLFAQWVLPVVAATASPPPQLASQSQTIARAQLALFVTILRCCATSLQVPYQKEADRAIVFLFYILGKGMLRIPSASNGDWRMEELSVLQALTRTSESGKAITTLLRAVHPFTALSYAVETGLLNHLLQQTHTVGPTSALALTERCLKLQIVLALVTPFGAVHNQAVTFIEQCSCEGSGGDSARSRFWKYEWQGDLRLLDAPPVSGRDKTDVLVPVDGTNKRFLHLRHSSSVWSAMQEICNHGDGAHVRSASLLGWLAWQLEVVRAGVAALAPSEQSSKTLPKLELGSILQGSGALCACYCHSTSAQCISELSSAVDACGALITASSSSCCELEQSLLIGYAHGIQGLVDAAPSCEAAGRLAATALGQVLVRGVLERPCPIKDPHALQRTVLSLLLDFFAAATGAAAGADLLERALKFSEHRLLLMIDCAAVDAKVDSTSAEDLSLEPMCICILLTALRQFADVIDLARLKSACRILLMVLMSRFFGGVQSGDMRSRTVSAVSKGLQKLSAGAISSCFHAPDVRSLFVETLISEYRHADCFDRAYACEPRSAGQPVEPQDSFSAVFFLFSDLIRQGHHAIVADLLRHSWGVEINFPAAEEGLSDLPRLHALVLCGEERAAHLECECVFLYVLRLLMVGLSDPAYCAAVRAHRANLTIAGTNNTEVHLGEDAVTVFCVLSRRALGEPVAPQETQLLADPEFLNLSFSLFAGTNL